MAAKINIDKCSGCGVCIEVCPVDAIKIQNQKAVVGDECVECGVCVNECPNEAIEI
jgi:NAD-dependent dihydropyrimidine dehydrogenase PreA subunit